jgi:hypothetical protein
LFHRPDENIHHELRLLCYKVEIEILEFQVWNDSGSSVDSGTLPDRVLSDFDFDEDYPGFTQHMRSHPFPRRTIFRTTGFGRGAAGGGACSGDGGGSAPANQALAGCPLSCPIRFGSFQCSVDTLCPKGSGPSCNKRL